MSRGGQQASGVVPALCVAGTCLCAPHAWAADWQVAPSAYVGSSYADNPRLLADGGSESSGAVGEISAVMKRLTPRSELSLRPRIRSARYQEDESLDSDDRFLTAGYSWLGERANWSSELGITRDTTLTSELGSTGLVQSNRRREATSLTVSPQIMFTERVSGGVQMSLSKARYIDAESTGLVDYRYQALSLLSTIALSDAGSSLTVTAQGGELTTPGLFGSGSDTRDATLRLGWSFRPSVLWNMTLSAGPSLVETDDGSDNDWVFDTDIKHQGERWSFTARGGRSQAPTGRGVLARRDELSLSLNRQLTERLSGNVGARWIRSEDSVPQRGAINTYEVDYGRLDLGASWRLSRDWSVALQLSGQTQDYELATERADGYRAVLSIVWNGQPQSL
jgi:hypothetical protein